MKVKIPSEIIPEIRQMSQPKDIDTNPYPSAKAINTKYNSCDFLEKFS